jgi:RNA polymerase sigma-70 factor, ECF subfamily
LGGGINVSNLRMQRRAAIDSTSGTDSSGESTRLLYEDHVAQVKRWAYRLAGPSADLEDLVHDIFVIALSKGFEGRGEAKVDTWLFSITDKVVRSKRRRRRVRELLLGRHGEALVSPSPATPQQELERQEQLGRLYRALDRLPDRWRTVLVLYELEDLAGDRIAELVGTTVGAVWVSLHRGRARLAALLAEENVE